MEQSKLRPFERENLHILFVGLNPATGSSRNGHYFSVNSSFWNQLYDSGLLTAPVSKVHADLVVFGANDFNYLGWSYGITDLITEIAESDSTVINVTSQDCIRLKNVIMRYEPKVVVLLHQKVVKEFLKFVGKRVPPANAGKLGQILDNCNSMFFAVAFPHGNTFATDEKVTKYIEIRDYLLQEFPSRYA